MNFFDILKSKNQLVAPENKLESISIFFSCLFSLFLFMIVLYWMNLLVVLMISPLLAIFILSCISTSRLRLIKTVSLLLSLFIFLLSCLLFMLYLRRYGHNIFEFEYLLNWVFSNYLHYRIGVDGISIIFVILTTFLIPICILCSWESVVYRVRDFFIFLFLIEFLLLNVFIVLDLILFYVFFESVLIPMFFMIGIWGSRERKIHAAYQFFLYTLFGSLIMLLGVLFIYNILGSTDFEILATHHLSKELQNILWLTFFLSFAVKMPMVPVHLWLPEAHVEAPTAGSVLLAGILLKMGGYGILRFMIPVFPDANFYYRPLVFTLSLIAIIYTSCTTLRQMDLKKIIAYSSVAHMNFVTLGIFSQTITGIEGSIFLMLTHGVISSGLFLCIGMIYERYGSRLLLYYGGLVQYMPLFCLVFFIFTIGNMGLPLTASFIGETLILLGIGNKSLFVALLAFSGVILGGIYSIWLYNRVCFGFLNKNFFKMFSDLNERELLFIVPLAILVFYLGVFSSVVLEVIHFSIFNLMYTSFS